MLTTEDKEEIKRIIAETFATSGRSFTGEHKRADDIDQVALFAEIILEDGFTELTFTNPKTGEKRVVEAKLLTDSIVEVTARAIEVFGTREKALRWLKAPVRSLGDQTPLSLLNSTEGVAQVQDILGRVEHGVW